MLALSTVIFACALVQSVFGVGLLVFGTPALLFLGYSFPSALFHLLPCSMLISSLQIMDDEGRTRGLLKGYLLFLAPSAALGAALIFLSDRHFNVRTAVGVMLLFSALLRFSENSRRRLARVLKPNMNAGLAAIGFVHGLTNMGGGLLTAFVNSVYIEKTAVRAGIALGYLIMAVVQFSLVLALKGPQGSLQEIAILMCLTLGAYLIIGRKLFSLSSQAVYQHSMTALMAVCGLLLLK